MQLGRQKERNGAKFKSTFLFLKIIDSKIDYNYYKIFTQITKKIHLYLHSKQLRPVIIQCTSFEYKEEDKYRQNEKLREDGSEAVKTINLSLKAKK